MFRPTARAILRTRHTAAPGPRTPSLRHISTQPPHLRSRSWKSSALRWGIAIAGIYYYNTSSVFAEQPHHNLLNPNIEETDESDAASVLDELTSRRSREAQKNHEAAIANASELDSVPAVGSGAAELEEEAAGEGAFNPETGEINWDCPCLGGMAHGPCGPQFREAFSCFVYSKEEPKGMDCIDKFQSMRDCFQEHPDVYRDELMEDEELDRELEAEKQELVNQIAERRKADEAVPTHNLLEEPDPVPRPSKSSSGQRSRLPSNESTSAESKPAAKPLPVSAQGKSHSDSNTTLSPDPHDDSEQELVPETQSSPIIKQPYPPAVRPDALPGTEDLVPKAAHDARSSIGPGGIPPQEK